MPNFYFPESFEFALLHLQSELFSLLHILPEECELGLKLSDNFKTSDDNRYVVATIYNAVYFFLNNMGKLTNSSWLVTLQLKGINLGIDFYKKIEKRYPHLNPHTTTQNKRPPVCGIESYLATRKLFHFLEKWKNASFQDPEKNILALAFKQKRMTNCIQLFLEFLLEDLQNPDPAVIKLWTIKPRLFAIKQESVQMEKTGEDKAAPVMMAKKNAQDALQDLMHAFGYYIKNSKLLLYLIEKTIFQRKLHSIQISVSDYQNDFAKKLAACDLQEPIDTATIETWQTYYETIIYAKVNLLRIKKPSFLYQAMDAFYQELPKACFIDFKDEYAAIRHHFTEKNHGMQLQLEINLKELETRLSLAKTRKKALQFAQDLNQFQCDVKEHHEHIKNIYTLFLHVEQITERSLENKTTPELANFLDHIKYVRRTIKTTCKAEQGTIHNLIIKKNQLLEYAEAKALPIASELRAVHLSLDQKKVNFYLKKHLFVYKKKIKALLYNRQKIKEIKDVILNPKGYWDSQVITTNEGKTIKIKNESYGIYKMIVQYEEHLNKRMCRIVENKMPEEVLLEMIAKVLETKRKEKRSECLSFSFWNNNEYLIDDRKWVPMVGRKLR